MKKLLVVIKDNLEYKNFVEYYFLLKKDFFQIYVISSVGDNILFKNDLIQLDNEIKILDSWNMCKTNFFDKVKYWLKRQLFYIENSAKSESCFQKMWIHFGYSEEKVLKGKNLKWRKIFSKFLRRIVVNNNILKEFIYSLSYKSKCEKNNLDIKFDYIIFMRPDSNNNIPIYNTFKTDKTKIITFIRNYDTPTLKGIFTVPSDITLTVDFDLKAFLYKLHNRKYIGKVFVLEFNRQKLDKDIKKKYDKILYCTSHPKFFPNEPNVLNNIMKNLTYKEFKIKLHPADSMLRYKFIDEKYFLKDDFFEQYKTKNGYLKFHSLKTITLHNNIFKYYNSLITHSSTIVVDAYKAGIKNLFFIEDNSCEYKEIFKREHIKILRNKFNIRKINFKGEICEN